MPDVLYCMLLGVYYLSVLPWHIRFNSSVLQSGTIVQILSGAILIILGVYIAGILVSLVRKIWLLIPSFVLLLGFLYLCSGMQKDIFDGLMIVFLALGAYGKDYRKLIKVLLWCTVGIIVLVLIGIPTGLTLETSKVGAYGTGLSFGFAHPNVFGSYLFFVFVTVWYLYVKDRSRLVELGYYVLSLALAVFMVIVPKCRTQALLLILFPLFVLLCRWVIGGRNQRRLSVLRQVFLWILIAAPVLCFLATVFLGIQREWLVTHTFGTYIENFSKRFIQAGLAFKEHGFPLLGEFIRFESAVPENLGGYMIKLYVIDNGYVSYAILRGMVWMVPALLWLSFVNWKAGREHDFGMLAISVLFCLMGLMERYTFTMYNFVFLYPLADMLFRDSESQSAAENGDTAARLEEGP